MDNSLRLATKSAKDAERKVKTFAISAFFAV
jgi:hypothetical protein